jgi:lipopolysaccharide export system permease protein
VLTAVSADVFKAPAARVVTLVLNDGRLLSTTREGRVYVMDFATFEFDLPLAKSAKLSRVRGDETSELTLAELTQQGFGGAQPALPRQVLLAELFSRISRALALPLLPLLAVPLGLSAKRAGSGPAMVIGGLMLFGFETALVLGQAMATSTHLPAAVTVGAPAALFATACMATWIASRRRPGQNPVTWLSERVAGLFVAIARTLGQRQALPE